jgi:2-haloacid dehalogenase
VFAGVELDRDVDAAVEHVLDGIARLSVHPDVPDGVRALRATGRRLVTLTNGATATSQALLDGAGIRDRFEQLLSVEDAGVWKPARDAYAHAAKACDVDLSDMLLVASHPWDIDGAARAGMGTAWVNRTGAPYPEYATAPQYTVAALDELATALPG